MTVTADEIIAAYRTLLGRSPDAMETQGHLEFGHADRQALIAAFIGSEEFAARFAQARLQEPPSVAAAGLASVFGMTRPATIFLGDRVLTFTHRHQRIFVPPGDIDIAPHLYASGTWEPHVEQAILRQTPPGGRAIDIGANIGYHTLALARTVGPLGTVQAIEANPQLIPLLRATLFINGLNQFVQLHHCAISDHIGTVELAQEPDHFGSGNIAPPSFQQASSYHATYSVKQQVAATTLDHLFAEAGPPVQLLRLDIEGGEPLALRGGAALIVRSPELSIITEWSVGMMTARADLGAFVAWLHGQGFRFWRIEPAGELSPLSPEATLGLPHSDLLIRRQEPR